MPKKASKAHAYLRLFVAHALPKSLDFYINQDLYAKDLLCEDFTPYYPISSGSHTLCLTPNGSKDILSTREVHLEDHKIYTLILAPCPASFIPTLYLIRDDKRPMQEAYCLVRFAHFTPYHPAIKLPHPDTSTFFRKVNRLEVTGYLSLSPSNYCFSLYDYETDTLLYTLKEMAYKAGRFYTFYLIGGSETMSLKCIRSIDGNSYLF